MLRRIVTGVTIGVAALTVLGATGVGCLTRPVEHSNPITKTNFVTSIPQGSIDKVDLLFDIDNSASMGDKQAYLTFAIPDLVARLVTPNCIDPNGVIMGKAALNGSCAGGASITSEFPPVHNLHIGIVSSSLGPRLGDANGGGGACPTTGAPSTLPTASGVMLDRHNDDQAHLLNRSADPTNLTNYTETPLAAATDGAGDNFLDWFPPASVNPANMNVMPTGPTPVTDAPTLQTDFQKLVVGVHQFGCGIESQLETWYRFLIQPDPYASLVVDKNKIAQWQGFDTVLLAQRADFLRPDSLVAILVLTDENDSEVDVRSFGGTGYNFMSTSFPPPRGTSACQSNVPAQVNSAACTSCGFQKNAGDPSCMTDVPAGGKYGVYPRTHLNDWGYDLNLRHVHEKQKYGVSVQFPIERYVIGLTSPKVPNRDGEYPPSGTNGGYSSEYEGTKNLNCTNPLFAATLPKPPGAAAQWKPTANDLCNLSPSTRKPGLIFYAHIGGVPHQLLQVNPADVNSPQKDTLTDADWQLILGKDPENYDYTGIDPHMAESYDSRITGKNPIPVPPNGNALQDSTTAATQVIDPISGREWVTDSTMAQHDGLNVDREYACIFKLVDSKTGAPTPRQCDATATTADPTLKDSCDCTPPQAASGSFSYNEIPSVCNAANPTQQDFAKAYPTVRELLLARKLGQAGGNEGIISSLCPIHVSDQSPDGMSDPLYGYRPAMNAIVNRLKQALSHECLPQRLVIDPTTNLVPCLVLGTFPSGSSSPSACADVTPATATKGTGYTDSMDPTIIQHFKNDQHAAWLAGGSVGDDPQKQLTCQLTQLPPNVKCDTGPSDGWCYIDTPGAVMGCTQAILFNPLALTSGVTTSLQCIEKAPDVLGDGG